MDTEVLKYSVGIDISKDEMDVCFKSLLMGQETKIKGTRKFPNTKKGFDQIVSWIDKRHKDKTISLVVVVEATGVYHENVSHYLHGSGYRVSIVLPNQSNSYMKSLGIKSKTDPIDSKALAQMGAERKLHIWEPPNAELMELRSLTRHKNNLQKMKTELKNRLHAQQHSAQPGKLVVKQLKSQIRTMDNHLKRVDKSIKELVEAQSPFNDKIKMVTGSIKGVGLDTVVSIVAETNGFELFKSQGQLISYSGYDVVENQSGKRTGKTRISKKGNSHIRKSMHFPALNVVRYGVEPFASLYNRVFERTKIKMKGYVAVQRKLLCMVYTLWKTEQEFDPVKFKDQQKPTQDELLIEQCLSSSFCG